MSRTIVAKGDSHPLDVRARDEVCAILPGTQHVMALVGVAPGVSLVILTNDDASPDGPFSYDDIMRAVESMLQMLHDAAVAQQQARRSNPHAN